MVTYNAVSRSLTVFLPSLCASAFVLLAGCEPVSDTPPTAPVQGTVTYQGKPVESGTVTFFPAGGERPGGGILESGGKFTLTTFKKGDGAVVGTHKVTVDSLVDDGGVDVSAGGEMKSNIPLKYSDRDQTPLSYDVKEGDNQFEIALED